MDDFRLCTKKELEDEVNALYTEYALLDSIATHNERIGVLRGRLGMAMIRDRKENNDERV